MPTCIFCQNHTVLKINNEKNQTAKADMFLFFGYQIEGYLKMDDAICNLCFNIIDVVARLKESMLPFIFRDDPYIVHKKPSVVGSKWEFVGNLTPADNPWSKRNLTPNGLISCKKVESYKPPSDDELPDERPIRCTSAVSGRKSARSATSSRRGRKRGKNWTRRKKGKYSMQYYEENKPPSVTSVESYESFYLPNVRIPSTVNLINAVKPISVYNRTVEYVNNCVVQKQQTNRQMALFSCECGQKFITSEELRIHVAASHQKLHSCVICKKEFYTETNLLTHWQIHVKSSVSCEYCHKRYINKEVLNKHKLSVHNNISINRIIFKNGHIENKSKPNDFEVRILIQQEAEKEKQKEREREKQREQEKEKHKEQQEKEKQKEQEKEIENEKEIEAS